MTPRRKQKLFIILGLVTLAAIAVGLTLYALRSNINLFFSPVQIAAGEAPVDRQIRAGGMVKEGSVSRDTESLDVEFVVTDFVEELEVSYSGILPDLFSEGQGVVLVGRLGAGGDFRADQVLAKHDENYMPGEVADALEEAGYSPADYRNKAAEVRASGARLDSADRNRVGEVTTTGAVRDQASGVQSAGNPAAATSGNQAPEVPGASTN